MKVPRKIAKTESVSSGNISQSFAISQLFPSAIATMGNGGVIHSPYTTLVAALDGKAHLLPDELMVEEGQAILIPATYLCNIVPKGTTRMELAAIDFCFKSHGTDISHALPQSPVVFGRKSAEPLLKDICCICNSAAAPKSFSQTTEQLAAGYRIANVLSGLLAWDSNPALSLSQDGELLALTTYLEGNCHLPLTIDDIAADCKMSRRKAFNVASRHAYRTPMRILKQIRLEKSLELLRREDVSINQAAFTVGFEDAKHFSREFKKYCRMTPIQYRQQSRLTHQTEGLVNKAEAHMNNNQSRRAAELYLQAIENAPSGTDLNELHYKAGLALRRAGNIDASREMWNKVAALHYRLRLNLVECEYHNKGTECDKIIEKLKRIHDYGDSTLRQNAVSQLGKWMHECAADQMQKAAKSYSVLAKECVDEHPELQPSLAQTLYSTGQFGDVERYCPDQSFYIAAALRMMGHYQEHLERFPEMRLQNALLHLRMGHTDVVLSDYEDQPEICVRALINAGRAEEAVTRFPQHCGEALMTLGRYDEILQQHPDNLEMVVFALANLGREDEALAKAAHSADFTSRLLFHMKRPLDIKSSPSRKLTAQVVRAATVLQGIQVLAKGDCRYGLEILNSVRPITDPDYRTAHEFYEIDLIVLLIRHLLADSSKNTPDSRWPPMASYLREVAENRRYCYDQRLWHDARFILGDADEADYLAQPYRLHSQNRLALAKGLKADRNGWPKEATESYRTYLENLTLLSHNYSCSGPTPVIEVFITWRLQELADSRV